MSHLTEKLFRIIDKQMNGREFKDEAEMQAFMNQFVGANIDDLAAGQELSDADRAMDLVDAARDASSLEERLSLLRQAVALDPGCCEAQVGLACMESRNAMERIERLEKAIAAEESRLGAELFKEGKGHFWGMHETRPYMRACLDRAILLQEIGNLAAAQKAYRAMIQLNKNDNQGVRMLLGPLCLQLGDLKAYRALRNKFKRISDLELLWCDVLEAFLLADLDQAKKTLAKIRKENGYLQAYLLGHRKLPKHMPTRYTLNSPEEAICAAFHLLPAWTAHPTALAWLQSQR